MRLWSLHPRHLDRQGLTACWREALLAQAVLAGRTRGYRAHPQLTRFRAHPDPVAAIGAYLDAVAAEASTRGYRFDVARIERRPGTETAPRVAPGDLGRRVPPIPVTAGQVAYEREHLLAKLRVRTPERATALEADPAPDVHPLFVVVPGAREAWEVGPTPGADR